MPSNAQSNTTTSIHDSDGSVSSCSDNSIFSLSSNNSSNTTSTSSTSDRKIYRPINSNRTTNFSSTISSIAINKSARMVKSSQSPLPPGPSYLRKRRHSADEAMDPPLPPARRGVVTNSSITLKDPPLTALNFDFAENSFQRDSIGRCRIETVPTSNVAANDVVEPYYDNGEDEQLEDVDDHFEQHLTSVSSPGSRLFQLGEPTEPRNDHSTHPLYSLENELKCSICRELMVAPHAICCGHTFCGMCLTMWIAGSKTDCPECRLHVIRRPSSIFPIYKLDGVIELIAQMIFNEREMDERRARQAEWLEFDDRRLHRRIPSASTANPFSDPLRHYSALLRERYTETIRGIQGSFGSESTSFVNFAVAPRTHGPAVKPRPIPRDGLPKSN